MRFREEETRNNYFGNLMMKSGSRGTFLASFIQNQKDRALSQKTLLAWPKIARNSQMKENSHGSIRLVIVRYEEEIR